jgi:TetR/AcrR family transcriptional regulator
MTRVMVGDALLFEHERLSARMNQCMDRLESLLRQAYRLLAEQNGVDAPTVASQAAASLAISAVLGRLHRFDHTGFKRRPTEHLSAFVQSLVQAGMVPGH